MLGSQADRTPPPTGSACFPVDLHTHTLVSGHAFGTVREMAQGAADRQLALLGFAEHGPGIPGTCDPIYFGNLSDGPRQLYGVALLYGAELNVRNDDGSIFSPGRYLDCLDYAIVGIHRQCYEDAGREKNTSNVIACMENEKVFFVSHPDDDHTPLNYERLVLGAKANHVALELNNSSLRNPDRRWNCVENYRTMLELCQKHNVPILVSSDAHDPLHVGRFEAAEAFLTQVGFDRTLVLNTSVEKVKAFLRMV